MIRFKQYPRASHTVGARANTIIAMTITETPTTTGIRRGVAVPPKVDSLDIAAVLAEIEAREFTSLPELGAKIGLGEQARRYAISEGLIDPEPLVSKRAGYTVSRDEAVTLLLAAALAIAAGVAIAVILRGLKQAGLTGDAAAAAVQAII